MNGVKNITKAAKQSKDQDVLDLKLLKLEIETAKLRSVLWVTRGSDTRVLPNRIRGWGYRQPMADTHKT